MFRRSPTLLPSRREVILEYRKRDDLVQRRGGPNGVVPAAVARSRQRDPWIRLPILGRAIAEAGGTVCDSSQELSEVANDKWGRLIDPLPVA